MHVVWGEIYTGHQCTRSQLYQLLVDKSEENSQEVEEFIDYVTNLEETGEEGGNPQKPIISLHAMLGIDDSQTIRLQGRIKNSSLCLLVDSSSTHNFMDQAIVKRLGCHTQPLPGLGVFSNTMRGTSPCC